MATSVSIGIDKLKPCIYRVPYHIRRRNKKAYTPTTVAIGPFHHEADELKAMVKEKGRYLKEFLHEHKINLRDLKAIVRVKETDIRHSYEHTIDMDTELFVEVILLDAVFIIELLTRSFNPDKFDLATDCIFGRERLIDHIRRDFWLVENQLPFFVLEEILNWLKPRSSKAPNVSLSELVLHFLNKNMADELVFEPQLCNSKAKHFLDLLPNFRSPESIPSATAFTILLDSVRGFCNSWVGHFLDFVRNHTCSKSFSIEIPSATELHQDGVKFSQSLSTNMFDIQFNDGTLEIPSLPLPIHSDVLYGNLIVFEQRHRDEKPLSDYFYLMHQLIKTNKDADLLIRERIIGSQLRSSEEVAGLINEMRNIADPQEKFYFSSLFSELQAFSSNNIQGYNRWFNNVTLQKAITGANFVVQCYAATMEQLELTTIFSYAMVLMILSLLSMLICIWELYYRMTREGFRWRWRRSRSWFYNSNNLPFISFIDIFGFLTAIGEGVLSVFILRHATGGGENLFRINMWPLINSLLLVIYILFGIVETPMLHLPQDDEDLGFNI